MFVALDSTSPFLFCCHRTPIKSDVVGGDVAAAPAPAKSSPSKSSTPAKEVVTTGSSPAKDTPSNLLDPKDLNAVDTGPTPPITPDRDAIGKPDGSPSKLSADGGSPKEQSTPVKQQSTSDAQSDGQSPGKDDKEQPKKGTPRDKKKTPNKKSPSNQSPPKSPKDPAVSKESPDPVKVDDDSKAPHGSESEKPADATSTTSTGGVPTSGDDVTGKVPRQRNNRQRPRGPRPRPDGGITTLPHHHNLGKTDDDGVAKAREEGTGVEPDKNQSPRNDPRRRRGRGPGLGNRPRPGYFPAQKTQPRVVNTVKSGDESETAADGTKKVTTSEGGPTEGSGTEPERTNVRRKRNRNKKNRRRSGSRNDENTTGDNTNEGDKSGAENGHDGDKVEGGGTEGIKRGPRRRRGPPRDNQAHGSDPEPVGDGETRPPRQNYGRGRGWRPRGSGGYFGRGRGGGWDNKPFGDRRGGYENRRDNDHGVDDRRTDRSGGHDDRRVNDEHRTTDGVVKDNVFRDNNHFNARDNRRDHDDTHRDRPSGYGGGSGYQRRDYERRDGQPFNRDHDSRSSYPGPGGYPARSYGNSNFGRGGRGGGNYVSGGGTGGNQGYRGRGSSFRGGYSDSRSGGGSGFNPNRGRQYGNQDARFSNDGPRRSHFSNNQDSVGGVTPIDVKGLPTNTQQQHTGGFWNA